VQLLHRCLNCFSSTPISLIVELGVVASVCCGMLLVVGVFFLEAHLFAFDRRGLLVARDHVATSIVETFVVVAAVS